MAFFMLRIYFYWGILNKKMTVSLENSHCNLFILKFMQRTSAHMHYGRMENHQDYLPEDKQLQFCSMAGLNPTRLHILV